VEQDVGVAVPAETLLPHDLDSSQKEAPPFLKSVNIIADAYAHGV
jgi:hypothetical protein